MRGDLKSSQTSRQLSVTTKQDVVSLRLHMSLSLKNFGPTATLLSCANAPLFVDGLDRVANHGTILDPHAPRSHHLTFMVLPRQANNH